MSVFSRQLPLTFQHEPGLSRDDLIIGQSNRAAINMIDRWPDWLSHIAILAGPTGSGKTHLATIWRSTSQATLVAAENIGPEAFKKAAKGPILIDHIGVKPFDEQGLFHLINTVQQSGTSLLITSRCWPVEWPVTLPDLLSRLKAAMLVELLKPDDALLTAVIYKLFADRQIAVESHIVSTLVSRIERSLSAANRVVEYLDDLAMEQRRKITRNLVAQVLAAYEERYGFQETHP